jgi:hypothetical protein
LDDTSPWDLRVPEHVQPWTALLIEHSSSVLGIYVSYANAYSAYEIIPVSLIDSPLALIPVRSQHIARDLWTLY